MRSKSRLTGQICRAALAALLLVGFNARASVAPIGMILDPIGMILDDLEKRVDDTMDRYFGHLSQAMIEGGNQLQLVIQAAKRAYLDSLEKTMADVAADEQASITSLRGLVNDYESQNEIILTQITQSAQQIANTFPMANTRPQVKSFSPIFVSQREPTVDLQIQGNFVDLIDKGWDATLTINGTEIKNESKMTQTIGFSIPLSALAADDHSITRTSVKVSIPYNEKIIGLIDHEVFAETALTLRTVPAIVGTVVVTETVSVSREVQQHFESQEFDQDSSADDIKCNGENGDKALHFVQPEAGWSVDPSSVTWSILWSQGSQGVDADFWMDNKCSQPNSACLCVSTEHHGLGTSGKVHFKIEYDATEETTDTSTPTQTINLGYPDHQAILLSTVGSWKATFTNFRGETYVYTQGVQPSGDNLLHLSPNVKSIDFSTGSL